MQGTFTEWRRTVQLHRILGLPKRTPQLYRRLRGPATRAEIARRCEISPGAVAGWEVGRHHPNEQALWILWLHFIDWTKRARLNPYDILSGRWPRPRGPLGLRTDRAGPEDRPVTPAAPHETPSKKVAPRIPPSPPPIPEGGEEKV